MRTNAPILLGLAAALLLSACGKKIDQKAVEASVLYKWRSCTIVEPGEIVLEEVKGKVARYTYTLKLKADGNLAGTSGWSCPKPDIALLNAFAADGINAAKRGDKITMTQESEIGWVPPLPK